jgi:hypothetical protein
MPEKVFKIRMYGFGELASEYKPHIAKKSAAYYLRRVIKNDVEFSEKLSKVKYYPNMKTLTPSMVSIIVELLGEPY